MARKCGTCGDEGHDSRNCPEINGSKEWKEIQKTLEKPTVLHISGWVETDDSVWGGDWVRYAKCGERSKWIPEKYHTDEYMKSLPICEKCKSA